ncbi:calmodulin-regulated spectrin-associated protein 1-B isoform X1 [Alosa sapidissima]|uniref:calmodulin-regulated spectrin-associated protein 1-B isoform X1 n=1 Tax=Alosa sapidissima TaxID=34773 RepID=UPI001C089883|nr:calmodulin-regulated spectrin-associated protein 1-B isoform X1 [Alosa sapidissima]XP_041956998.1 calmodulin-regulated spectrin-associated protein 1-B isoform X1 [Alosa sapidissima]XP_041956999.1 calmodulin-regulated spectrin-associated protein 1-B isoform X1 [Alosa sapidissima]
MDMDLGAGGDSARRKMDLAGEVTEVVPLEMYDSARAKIAANLRWLFAKAYGIDNIPEDLRDPFYTDQYEQEHIKPPVIRLLLSCELYCRVCGLILKGDQVASLQSHLSVIQALSRKGIYVMESDDTPVTESDLGCMPIKMSSHIPMIDALMMAYTVEMISIERVVACVKRFSTFSASKELPFDLEDAMVFWINKVNMKMREISEKEVKVKQHLLESPSHQKSPSKWYWKLVPVRYRRDHASGRQMPYFPLVEELMRDVCDGAALLTVVHYYCPNVMKLDDICLKEVTSIADSLYNIQLLREFATEYLNKGFYLTLEDMLYAPLVLKHNVMVFIAELFWWFEIVKPEFVQPRDIQESKDARSLAQPKSLRPSVPISNATKRSFLVTPGMADPALPVQNSADVCNRYLLHPEDSNPPSSPAKGSPSFSLPHPLLPLRQRQQKPQQGEDMMGSRIRSNSFTQDSHRGAGWAEKRQRPLSQMNRFLLHSATDSDVDMHSGDSASLTCSISEDSLAASITPKHQGIPRRVNGHGLLGNVNMVEEDDVQHLTVVTSDSTVLANAEAECQSAAPAVRTNSWLRQDDKVSDGGFYLEPLMPAALKPAKEKSINLNKEEESGELCKSSTARRVVGGSNGGGGGGEQSASFPRRRATHSLNRTFTPNSSAEFVAQAAEANATAQSETPPMALSQAFKPLAASSAELSPTDRSPGFFLHSSAPDDDKQPEQAWEMQSDSDTLDLADEQELELSKDELYSDKQQLDEEDQESAKLREDMSVKEHEDKDKEGGGPSSRCSSPGLSSVHSAASSVASGSVRMTSFAERKLHHSRFGSNQDLRSASSSQRTTPDGSENSYSLPVVTSWRSKRDQSPTTGQQGGKDSANVLASELVQLRMQLEEKRRAIETQKRKMEVLSARQRLKLGKVAFLHIVKKGKSDTLPQPIKSSYSFKDAKRLNGEKEKEATSKDDACVDALRAGAKEAAKQSEEKGTLEWASSCSTPVSPVIESKSLVLEEELDLNECNRSIEMLNDAIGSIQQQMMQLSLQQELLMKQNVMSPPSASPLGDQGDVPTEGKYPQAIHFDMAPATSGTVRKPPKLSSARGSRSKPSELKLAKDAKQAGKGSTPTQRVASPGSRTPRAEPEEVTTPDAGNLRSSTPFQLNEEANLRKAASKVPLGVSYDKGFPGTLAESEYDTRDADLTEEFMSEEELRSKANLIEVDLSELAGETGEELTSLLLDAAAADGGDGEKKSGMGFFFKDDQKAEDELAKKRAAFLLKQQRKAEETRLRKLQLEADSEQKRDEARRKADADRIRKEEEKARRELIKQEYLRRKQQEIFEEQGQGQPKAKPKPKPKKQRPKSVFHDESVSDGYPKCSPANDNLINAQSGSSLSLASVATTGADSVNSGGAGSQRGESVESFPGLSRNSSRATERDWDNGSTASSITSTSMAEYTGPKLFKEPSAKSNKPIIHNAIAHCCLAGKVNEPHKNSILEELEKCESNHLMILFRDGGCMFRALYSYFPDTEEIQKLTGTGPKNISKKMIDKLYKYSSDRKQFTVIPAKTVSVSVDALTIHNHLWQVKRPGPKRSGK